MSTDLTSDEQRAIGEACRDLHIAHVEYRQVEAGWLARAAYERPSHPGRQAAIEAALAFYADPNHWDGAAELIWADSGTKARAALAEQPHSAEPDGREAVSADDLAQAIDGVAEQPREERVASIQQLESVRQKLVAAVEHARDQEVSGRHNWCDDAVILAALEAARLVPAEQPRSEEERATPQPDMHVAYLGRCVEATEVERDQAQAALTTERHRTQVAEGERDEARAEAERLRDALKSLNWNAECTLCRPCAERVDAAFSALAASQEET